MKISPVLLGLSLAVIGSSFAAAQDAASTPSIPQVLQITREYLKPYKAGAAHDKTESAFINSMTKAKIPAYYLGLNSMSGRSRAIYLAQYASFAEWEKDNKLVDKNPSLAGEMERNGLADGELLQELDSAVYTYDADLSYHPHADISHARYMEIIVFQIKPGHHKEWVDLVKMVTNADEKGHTSAHWATFDMAYGGPVDTYISLTAHNSMTDIDTGFAEGKKFVEGMGGEEGMQKFDKLYGETVESMRIELFSVNPKQSYVNPDWIKADPDFWKPRAAAAPAARSAIEEKKP